MSTPLSGIMAEKGKKFLDCMKGRNVWGRRK